MVKLANTPIIRFKKRQKSFSFAELNSQTCKALIRWKYHEIIWINHVAYMGGEYPRGGRYSEGIRPLGGNIPRVFGSLLRGGRISWGGQSPVTTAWANCSTFLKILSCPPQKIWVCPSNAPPPKKRKILRPGAATATELCDFTHFNMLFLAVVIYLHLFA
jgi:hypothetical protein